MAYQVKVKTVYSLSEDGKEFFSGGYDANFTVETYPEMHAIEDTVWSPVDKLRKYGDIKAEDESGGTDRGPGVIR